MPSGKAKNNRAKVRTVSVTDRDDAMLDAIARYHCNSKGAIIAGLIRKEFWRLFLNGTDVVELDEGLQIKS